ncbi:methylenetetrahydrofolate reductase (NADH), partial [Phenoliferia sp. Uapishka_3]
MVTPNGGITDSARHDARITSKLAALAPDTPFYSFEVSKHSDLSPAFRRQLLNFPFVFQVFPPKTDIGTSNLVDRIERMRSLQPAWLHVTWGAGGSTQETSLNLAGAAQTLGIDTCLHLTCTNMLKDVLDGALKKAEELGVVNLLALRGDPPRGEEYWTAASDEFQHATDLVRYIRDNYPGVFCIGVAGYPEGHADSDHKLSDIEFLFQKQEAGADFVVTQLFYDVDLFMEWYRACRARGITIPILPGIMPIQNYQSFRRMTNLCKSRIPPHIVEELELIQHDDAAVKDYGVNLAATMMRSLRSQGIMGYHLCTLNLEKSVTRLLQQLEWVTPESIASFKHTTATPSSTGLVPKSVNALRTSGTNAASTGVISNRTDSPASWDEFPNGRFGDARSPAYGDLDGYGVGLKLPPAEALRQWGRPTKLSDISTLFSSYLSGTLPSIPWSEEPLRAETTSISKFLFQLNDERHWWTVGSQPAVDGAPSGDATHGFGPKGGYVYQKAFVELFLSEEELLVFEKRAKEEADERRAKGLGDEGVIKYFAGNRKGESRSNMGKGDVNAVTWGVFPGKEIVTTTLIEEMSFKAWKEEAFSIWMEWSYLYPADSPSRKFIQGLADSRWLVSVCHHDFRDESGLWRWLLDQPVPTKST